MTAVAAGWGHSLAVRNDGTVWAWGSNEHGQLGNGTIIDSNVPLQVSGVTGMTTVAAGFYHSLAIRNDGTLWAWGSNNRGTLGNGTEPDSYVPIQVQGLGGVTGVGAAYNHSLAVKNDGTVWTWGHNLFGQLGNGTYSFSTLPVHVQALSGGTGVAGGLYHSLAVRNDGSVWAWGRGHSGQIGNGAYSSSSVPVRVSGLTGMTTVAAGFYHSLAVRNDGTVWAWGRGYAGQLGNGGNSNSPVPVQVYGLTEVTSVSGGDLHSLASRNDGTAWAWGDNGIGQLGNGTTSDSRIAVQVLGLTGVTSVTAGMFHSLALKNDGSVWAWGSGFSGELGNGQNYWSAYPVRVLNLTGVTAIAAGADHSLAIRNDGTVWAWGYNLYGQLGNGTISSSNVPVQVSGLTGATAIAGGWAHSLAIKDDGTVWAWGSGYLGQLGTGTEADSHVPVQVSAPTGIAAIAGGGDHSLAAPLIPCLALTLAPPSLQNGTQGTPYSQTISATSGVPPYRYTVVAGSLPPGLLLGLTAGLLSGTPTTPGIYNFTVRGTDAKACTGTRAYTLVIGGPSCGVIAITPATLPWGVEGVSYKVTLTAAGGTPPYTFAVTGGALPPGTTLNNSTGEISGTPTVAGRYTFEVTATDAINCTGRQSFDIDVRAAVDFVVGEGLGLQNSSTVRVYKRDGTPTPVAFQAYKTVRWGTTVAAGDINGGIYWEILTGPGPGDAYGPQVRAFQSNGIPIARVNFYAYGTLRYGVNVGATDLDGDGFQEILSGRGPGPLFAPHVRGWNFDNVLLQAVQNVSFFAYLPGGYGVVVGDGDVEADGYGEILSGPGPGPALRPRVRGWNYDNARLTPISKIDFNAYPIGTAHGVNVAGGDIDRDGNAELATVQGPGSSYAASFLGWDYDGVAVQPIPNFSIAPFTSLYGGRLGLGDSDGNGFWNLLAAPGPDPAAPSQVDAYGFDTGVLLLTTTFQPFKASTAPT